MWTKTGSLTLNRYASPRRGDKDRKTWRVLVVLLLTIAALTFRPAYAQDAGQGDSDAYVEATVDNTNPYVGEEITYLFRYYEAVDAVRLPNILVGQPDYDAPEFANFWQEGDITQINYQQMVNNRLYNVSELHTTIFPTAAGDLEIPPAKLILDGGFSGRRVELHTLPVTVAVKPLPNADANLAATAVGDYTLTAQVDATSTVVDEPITLRLTLRGTGNIRLAPALPDIVMDGWRVLRQSSEIDVGPTYSLATDSTDSRIGGTVTAVYLLIPSQPGEYALPALEYPFFDPILGETRYALTNPIALSVSPGAGATTSQAAGQDADFPSPLSVPADASGEPAVAAADSSADTADEAAASQTEESTAEESDASVLNRDFDPIALMTPLVVSNLQRVADPLVGQTWYWTLWTLPVAAVGLAGWAAWRGQRTTLLQAQQHRARAGSDALRQMHGQHTASPADMVASAQHALLDFIGRKLNRPAGSMARASLAAELTGRGVDPSLVQRVVECMHLGDMARFSPTGVDALSAMQMQATVETTIRDLDKVL